MNQSTKYLFNKKVLFKFKKICVIVYKGGNSVSEEFEIKYNTLSNISKL